MTYALQTTQTYSPQRKQERNFAMTESIMLTKAKDFALRIVRLYKYLRDHKESIMQSKCCALAPQSART